MVLIVYGQMDDMILHVKHQWLLPQASEQLSEDNYFHLLLEKMTRSRSCPVKMRSRSCPVKTRSRSCLVVHLTWTTCHGRRWIRTSSVKKNWMISIILHLLMHYLSCMTPSKWMIATAVNTTKANRNIMTACWMTCQ